MTKWMTWWYHDEDGGPIFQHYRVSDPGHPRGKRYGYRTPRVVRNNVVLEWEEPYRKHPLADTLIYRLPLVLSDRHQQLWITEGERDADELLHRRVLATCVHGGAGKWTEAQAAWLAGHRGAVVLVADNDPAGAYDVCRRYDLLRDVGIPAKRLRVREVAPTHPGADLRDHLDAGYKLRDLRRGSLARLRELAAGVTPATFAADGYCTPEEIEQLKSWKPTVVSRLS